MAAPSDRPLIPTHIRDPELVKLLKLKDGEEYLTKKERIRIRKLVSSLLYKSGADESLGRYIAAKHPQFITDDAVNWMKTQEVYLHAGLANLDTSETRAGEEDDPDPVATNVEAEATSQQRPPPATQQQTPPGDPPGSSSSESSDKSRSPARSHSSRSHSPAGSNRSGDRRSGGGNAGGGSGDEDGNNERRRRDDDGERNREEEAEAEEEEAPDRTNEPRVERSRSEKHAKADDITRRKEKKPRFDLESIYATGHSRQAYDKNQKPIEPETYKKFYDEKGTEIDPNKAVPDHLMTKNFFEAMDILYETNGPPCYDSEAIALGEITEAEYFLMPDTIPFKPCGPESVISGSGGFNPNVTLTAQIYALAKGQARDLGIPRDRRVRWALMRAQAFVAGWYCRQKYTRFAAPPANSITTYVNDVAQNKKIIKVAYKLAAFIPFFHEVTFRTIGSTWSVARASEFESRAKKMAASSTLDYIFTYTDAEDIFGSAFRWIGVKRVMDVLKAAESTTKIPNVFIVRKKAAPSGQAFVTTANACIQQIDSAGWWKRLKEKGGYADSNMIRMAKRIEANPWKYHMMHGAYGLKGLSRDEEKDLQLGRDEAAKVAPLAHAYATVFLDGFDLANNKVLKKFATNAGATFARYTKFFQARKQERANTVDDLFCTRAFYGKPEEKGKKKEKSKKRKQKETDDDTSDEE